MVQPSLIPTLGFAGGKDGSQRIELDGEDDYYYEIVKIEDSWIYYIKGRVKYKIRIDGSYKAEFE